MSEQQPHRHPGPVAAASAELCILHRQFETLVAAQPRAPLVVYGEWRLSYQDVNAAANRLAHRLMALGVARNIPVGLCLDRGPDLLVAILAVLKAGGAYVPLDPHWPADRLRRMRAAVDPRVLVSRTVFLQQFADHAGPVVDLDRDQSAIAAGSAANPEVPIDLAQWCYVLFTSGSTGTPKGVPVTHGNLIDLFPPLTAALDLGPGDVWTWFHSASFGFSVWELWGALLHGGSIVIVPENIRQDPAALGELVAEEHVTVFSQTPSAFRRVLHDARFHSSVAGSRLRYLALSGEAIRRDDIAGWLARGHQARLINTYAITETAGQVALRVYGDGDATEEGARNLGQPLAGRELLVLDADGRPVPAGTAGELWVGGACVTPGYLAAPEQASRFSEIAVPGGGIVRGYRTGDRVRQLTDRSLEYLGRVDAQLKFRGYRIEPGDIESALRDHPGVRDAAVGLRADAAGNQRLTTWVVAGESRVPALSRSGALEFWPSLGAYGIYDEWLYGLMNTEPVRLAAYRAAFAAAVPGKVVLDIGTGEDAVLARLCVEAGAAHVYAVEVLEAPARAATELVRRLGMQDRITVLHGDIADLDLPQAVDVCTQGIIGNIGSADGIGAIWNAARRHFAPGCVPVPERCVTRIAALELPAAVRAEPRFGPLAADYARRLFESVGQPFDLRLCVRNVAEDDLLTAPAEFEVLDFNGELAATHSGGAELRVTRDGLFDGCLLWTVVTAGAGQTVDYFREQRAWLPVYLPLGDEPLPVRRGDCLQLRWESSLDSDSRFPDYSVTATLAGAAGPVGRAAVTRHRSSSAGGTHLHRILLAQLAVETPDTLAPTVTELRRWLDTRVPEHLVPQSWVFLTELPLGPGDKLDRDALPAPGTDRPHLAGPPVAPRSAAEQAIADLWTEVTGLEALGVEDDFFELGGDSITAVQLVTHLQRWLDAGVPLAALFDTPTIAGLARYLQQHFPDALAAALSRAVVPATTDDVAPDPEMPLASERTPLTFSQQSLWFLHDLYPGDTSASEQFAIRLGGPLDRAALERAWAGVIRRHPILTATFQTDGDQVWQVETGTCLISRSEMRHVPVSVEGELLAIAERELREIFNLRDGPPVRALLCTLTPEAHVLLVTAHHIVADGMSVPVLQAELAQMYAAEAGGGPATVTSATALSYADLASQPDWQQGMADPEALDWWRRRLADLPPPALRELVRPHRASNSEPRLSRRVPFTIEASVANGVRHLARATGATPYMVLLAAFRTLLVRLTAQADICIGTPMTLRDTPELRGVVGCLVNPVVLRAPLDATQSFRAHLQTERAAALDAFRYRKVPFARVVEAVAPARELGIHPLFQLLFSWEPAPTEVSTADGITLDLVALPAVRSSYFDLECALRDAGEGAGLSGHFAWSASVLEDWVAEQLPRLFGTLLGDVLARPDTPIERLAVLTAAESRRLLVEWNATGAALPTTGTLHESFLAAAARCPEAVAIRDERGDWSYADLAARSAALASEITAAPATRDAGAGFRVGVALGRSPELVLAVLAVLRAGGIVVPLDPGFPRARLQFMARDADLALVLARCATLPNGVEEALLATGATVIDLDRFKPDALVDGRIPMAAGAGDAPAMMLYTSGSTGQPKGAITTHRSAVNRCHWMWTSFGFRDDEVFSLRTSLNFIDAWWEIFGALSHGATLAIVPDDVATDPLRLPRFLAERGVTQLVLVPSLLRALLEQLSADEQALPALRWCIASGEPLTPELVAECARRLPCTTLLNTYGTSEIWDATAFDTRQLAGDGSRVPIGRPIANVRVYVVDPAGQPLPPGFPGELQVAGVGVGPGYWRRPELTAEKFGRLDLPEVSEALVYRTGDRARFLADGRVECLGRLDAQFKLRGQRIEPAEIEQAITAHPAVAGAVVGLAGEGSAAVLVAGVVRSTGSTLPAATLPAATLMVQLREHLQALLPAWMVPTEWCELPALPHTPTGKLDRRDWLTNGGGSTVSLPATVDQRAPRGDVEQQLALLWSAVLGRDTIGVHDNFFDLGGHSLLAARLLNRIRTAFGVSMELRALFATPTVAGLSLAIEAARAAHGADAATPALPAPDQATLAPLSFGQERLWFLDQLDPGSPAYNVAWTIRCTGPLDVPALRAALDAIVARHPALRTRFPAVAGRPTAVIDPAAPVALVVRDLTGSTALAADLATHLAAELSRVAREPFVLDREPLFRATLLKTGAHDHHLVFVAQHIVTDATSNHLLFADLVGALACTTKGQAPQWPALPLTYTDYARRQRAQATSPRLVAALAWWRQQLAGAPAALELPADRPRPAEQRFVGAWLQRLVPPELEAELHGYARGQGCTTYMVLLAAFKALLHRYSGAVDVLVGTPVEGRLTADVEPVVGLFINTLVMRTDLSGDPSFSTLLARVRETTLDAQAHQEAPFEQLVEALAPERSLRRSPVFQFMFNLVQLPVRSQTIGDLELRVDKLIDQGVSSFDLTLTAAVEPGQLALTFEYATDLFDARTIGDFADAYLTLLQGALRDPGLSLSRLPLLATPARQSVLALGRPGDMAPLQAPVPVHELVARHAHTRPDAVAVVAGIAPTGGVHGDGGLSYAALDAQANRLARQLLNHGAGAGARIGICLPRTPDYLVAVLAVLKSGAAYVPLDPDYPAARLAGMIADANLSGVIVNPATRGVVGSPVPRLDLDADRADIARQPATDPMVTVQPGDAAYLLYTSGSTGRPKGVLVSHDNLARALAGWQSAYALQPGEAHLQMASAAFDVFTGDWVRALGTGGCLVLCPRNVLLDPPALLALLQSAAIRIAEFVPAVIRLLIEHCETVSVTLPRLRLLIVGSDLWYGAELDALRRIVMPGTRLVNSYGVAEATIDSSWFEAGDAILDGPVPVGAAMPGTTLYVLDANGEPMPRGVPGELCVGGGGVAIGYWNDPELTAAKFRADPFAEAPGARLYCTGDRARWNSAGQLELLGRSDAQFKLRGFRIEPAEIEACLVALSDVAAAAVGLQTQPGPDPRLVAWIVPRRESVRSRRWQEQLRRQLPEHMVPSVFIEVPALPLTPNGKVDRAALAGLTVTPSITRPALTGVPENPTEATLCRLYGELLGMDTIGVEDDFFRAGGHSLLATRLVARLRAELKLEVPLRLLFELPTPRGLAAALVAGLADPQRHRTMLRAPSRRARAIRDAVPLSAMQQRVWFLERLQPGTPAYHLHWLLRIHGPLDRAALQAALTALVARHEVLRTAFSERAGVPGQVIAPHVDVPVELMSGADAAPIRELIARPFNLAAAPLLRVTLLESGTEDHRLLIVMHHLIADGWSFSVLSRELAAVYNAVRQDRRVMLPELPLQYADYALWQQETIASGNLSRQVDFWRHTLADAPPVLRLPAGSGTEGPAAGIRDSHGAWIERRVPAATLAALRELAGAQACTLFMVLLAGFKAVLGRLAGTTDVLVGTPVAGRSHRELEDLIGFFINTLVLRTDLAGEPTFTQLLGRVRQTTLQAFDHADVPFEKLVEVLQPRRSLAHSPLVQVLFALHNQPQQPLELDALRMTPENVASDSAKFDLNLHAAEEGTTLRLSLAWRTGLYSAEAANSLLDHYVGLLQRLVDAPDAGLSILLEPVPAAQGRPLAPTDALTVAPGDVVLPSAAPGPVEVALGQIWNALLGSREIGLDDDFFAAGGHSLLATRLIAAIADRLGVELPLISVFEAPTVRALSLRIAERQAAAPRGPAPIPRLPRHADHGGAP